MRRDTRWKRRTKAERKARERRKWWRLGPVRIRVFRNFKEIDPSDADFAEAVYPATERLYSALVPR